MKKKDRKRIKKASKVIKDIAFGLGSSTNNVMDQFSKAFAELYKINKK